MICTESNVTNAAIGGKMARPCDSCVKKRARLYCAADDAFLCQSCDASVHSANPLARRHERVRLKPHTSLKSLDLSKETNCKLPSWHKGFTRKARTPRKHSNKTNSVNSLVPEVGLGDEYWNEENAYEELLYRVPIYDPLVVELRSNNSPTKPTISSESNNIIDSKEHILSREVESLNGFSPSDPNLTEFAADMDSLLGKGLENELFVIEELGLVESKEEQKVKEEYYLQFNNNNNSKIKKEIVLVEEEEVGPSFEFTFDDYQIEKSHITREVEEDDHNNNKCDMRFGVNMLACDIEDMDLKKNVNGNNNNNNKRKRRILLSLDYDAVITAWASRGSTTSPWTTGDHPHFDAGECWPDCTGTCGNELYGCYGDGINGGGGLGGHMTMAAPDHGREARVSRYREKRRTRLFSKKIRYEVRKLNAEKRPRMKGRFVKAK